MAYSKAKLKSNGDKASPCFKPFLIGNMSDKFLPTWTPLCVSVRHILTSLTSFMGIPNSMRILYKTYLLTKSYVYRHRTYDNNEDSRIPANAFFCYHFLFLFISPITNARKDRIAGHRCSTQGQSIRVARSITQKQ